MKAQDLLEQCEEPYDKEKLIKEIREAEFISKYKGGKK